MTKEEYRSRTKITSIDEAKSHLLHLRILFIVVFIAPLIRDVLISSLLTLLVMTVLYVGLWIYFIVYCVKVTRLTREVTKADAFWSIFLAPISWIWFYPAITRPLQIIIGSIEPPETTPTATDRALVQKNANKRFFRTLAYVVLVIGLFLLFSYFTSKR